MPLKCNKDYPMTLYVMHRTALLGHIKLREAKLSDRDGIQELLQNIPKAEQVLIDFDIAMDKKPSEMRCYVCQWKDRIIGVAILW